MLIDYHTHNHFSSDSTQETVKIAKRAIALGIDEICITNHVETFPPDGGKGAFDYEEAINRFTEVRKDIQKTQKEFPNLAIKFGVELEYVEEWMNEMKRFVDDMGFDFMIGSVHDVEGHLISSSRFCHEFYKNNPESYSYGKYFEYLHRMVEWGHFSVVGHFDICKKGGISFYGPFEPKKLKGHIIPILELMEKKGIGIELNTSGLRYDCNQIFPHPDILKWCKEVGIEHYTIASDAHETKDIGADLDKALALLKDVGIDTISTYEKGVPTKFQISDF